MKDNIYYELLKYQKANPIDGKAEKLPDGKQFIYQISILPAQYVNSADHNVAIYITCSPLEIIKDVRENMYGIYESPTLRKTYIIDEANEIKTITKVAKKDDLQQYVVKKPLITDLVFPVKMFILRNDQLIFLHELPGISNRKKIKKDI